MAKNRMPEPDPDPEESQHTAEESSDESTDEEPPEQPLTQIRKKPSSIPQTESSSSDDGSETESEPEPGSRKPNPNVKPISSKPMDKKPPSKPKPSSKSKPSEPMSPVNVASAGAGAKRPASAAVDGEVKKSKKKKKSQEESVKTPVSDSVANDDSKKQLFQRIWSEDDEIVILKGMIDYAAKKRGDPLSDLSSFHAFIKKSLHNDSVTDAQLLNKIKRLKKKFENNKSKRKLGKERTFSNPHEQKSYDLSKKIWGDNNNNINNNHVDDKVVETPNANASPSRGQPKVLTLDVKPSAVSKEVKKDAVVENGEKAVGPTVDSLEMPVFCSLGLEEWISKAASQLVVGGKRDEFEEEWKQLKVKELELYLKKLDLMRAHVEMVLGSLKSTRG